MDNSLPQRRNPASGAHVYLGHSNIFFLTITTLHRAPWLANEVTHQTLQECWQEAADWLVGDYVIMPDHLHAFCAPRIIDRPIENWITFWKRRVYRRLEDPAKRFQSRGWHHRLRHSEDYHEKWEYVRANPVRKGLVVTPESWPFQGRLNELRWSGVA